MPLSTLGGTTTSVLGGRPNHWGLFKVRRELCLLPLIKLLAQGMVRRQMEAHRHQRSLLQDLLCKAAPTNALSQEKATLELYTGKPFMHQEHVNERLRNQRIQFFCFGVGVEFN